MDALIAEQVMGIVLCKHVADEYGKCQSCGLNKSFWERIQPPAYYSTDIAAAWTVVEKLRKENCCLNLFSDHDFIWVCWLIDDADSPDHNKVEVEKKVNVTAETAPMAICLAALKAQEARMTS